MQEYKIKIPNPEVSKQVQDKAIQLGYPKNEHIYDNENNEPIESIYLHYNELIKRTGWGGLGDDAYFHHQQFPEISYQDFLRIGEPIEDELEPVLTTLNTNTEIMSEMMLKCSKEPKNAKNLTVGHDYSGILIDADNSQVDSLKDAKFFLCTNNSGNEARYNISLFAEIPKMPAPRRRAAAAPVPPTPPPPPAVVTAPFEDFINNTARVVVVDFDNNDQHIGIGLVVPREGVHNRIVRFDNRIFYYHSDISCGFGWINGLNSFVPSLVAVLTDFSGAYYNGTITQQQIQEAVNSILKEVLQKVCEKRTKSFLMLSTNDDCQDAVVAMDEISVNEDISGININSDNNIHVWIFKNGNVA